MAGTGLLRWGGGPPHAEMASEMYPWRARGLYPDPGRFKKMLDRNPVVGPGMRFIEDNLIHLSWQSCPPPAATSAGPLSGNELAQAAVIDWTWRQMRGGFPGFLRAVLSSLPYGFSVLETIWRVVERPFEVQYRMPIEPAPAPEPGAPAAPRHIMPAVYAKATIPAGTLLPAGWRWVAPWTVQDWVIDAHAGQLLGLLQRSERGLVFLPAEKLQHYARGFYSDNYEGQSALRPLWWLEQAMIDEFVSDRVTRERWGEGTLKARWTAEGVGEQQYDPKSAEQMEDMLQRFQSGSTGYMVLLPGWDVGLDYGGASFPDPIPRLQQYTHFMERSLGTGVVKDLGQSKFGSKAGMEAVANEGQRQLSGICYDLCCLVGQEFIRPIARHNGWNEDRMPHLSVAGFIDDALLSNVFRFAQANLLGERADDPETFRRMLRMES